MDPELHIVRGEVHYLPICPCSACEAERDERFEDKLHSPRLVKITPEAAYILGFIPRPKPKGSLAKQLAEKG